MGEHTARRFSSRAWATVRQASAEAIERKKMRGSVVASHAGRTRPRLWTEARL
jgi:hypothetical protein